MAAAGRTIALGALLTLVGLTAQAADASLERARQALLEGRFDEAERFLAAVDEATADRNDLDFLRGTLASGRGDAETAIARFKAVLARDPAANRVRLDLARVYYLIQDDVAAEFHFRAALAQGVPPEVEKNVRFFLDQMARRQRWDADLSVALTPDSNINAATTASSVDLFGLPFQLDPSARRKSGVGVSATVSGSYQWRLSDDSRFKVGAAYYGAEYGDESFSDRNLSVYAGPRFLVAENKELSVFATGGRRWHGGAPLSASAGGRLEGALQMSTKLRMTGSLFGQANDYSTAYEAYSGPLIGANGLVTYMLDARSFVRSGVTIARERTDLDAYRNMQYAVSAGYYRGNLPLNFAVYGEVRASLASYDAPLPVFGETRRDVQMDYRVSLSNTNIDIYGFTPVVTFTHTDRTSNIALFEYRRNRVEIGVVRNF